MRFWQKSRLNVDSDFAIFLRKSAIIFPISAMFFLHAIHWQISDNVWLYTATDWQLYSLMSLELNAEIIAMTQKLQQLRNITARC